jgi:hypothetical protein
MFHTAYNSYESKPNGRDYLGKHSSENPYDDYKGSFNDDTFEPDSKIIMAYSKTAEGAVWFEINFHNVFDVARDPQYANKVKQTDVKFDTTGLVRDPLTTDQKKYIAVKTREAMQSPEVVEKLREANERPETREARRIS